MGRGSRLAWPVSGPEPRNRPPPSTSSSWESPLITGLVPGPFPVTVQLRTESENVVEGRGQRAGSLIPRAASPDSIPEILAGVHSHLSGLWQRVGEPSPDHPPRHLSGGPDSPGHWEVRLSRGQKGERSLGWETQALEAAFLSNVPGRRASRNLQAPVCRKTWLTRCSNSPDWPCLLSPLPTAFSGKHF